MRVRNAVIAVLALILLRNNVAAAPHPAQIQPYMKPVDAVVAAMMNHTGQQFNAAYTPDATISDDQAPYRWSGSTAGHDWLSAVTRYGKLQYARFTTVGDPMNLERAGNNAYVTVLGALHGVGPRSGLREDVILTFSLSDVNGAWKITSQSWTALPPGLTLRLR
jgi:hypothetical protein